MAKRGRPGHLKRLAAPKALPITDKKAHTWIIHASPGPHSKRVAIPLTVLLRDVLHVASTMREIKKALNARVITIDGTVRTDGAYPVGLMDAVAFADKSYRVLVDSKSRLMPVEIPADDRKKKIMKVVGKYTAKGGKISLRLHDGRVMSADNNVKVGDSLVLSLPGYKIEKVLKLEKGARCLVQEGKHAGVVAKLDDLIVRREGKDTEAKLSGEGGEFTTVAKYLFVVDDSFNIKGAS
jgi:small subunit ribosomal protein S4e